MHYICHSVIHDKSPRWRFIHIATVIDTLTGTIDIQSSFDIAPDAPDPSNDLRQDCCQRHSGSPAKAATLFLAVAKTYGAMRT